MGWGGWGGWLDTDNRAISGQLNLTGTATGTELGKKKVPIIVYFSVEHVQLSISYYNCIHAWLASEINFKQYSDN